MKQPIQHVWSAFSASFLRPRYVEKQEYPRTQRERKSLRTTLVQSRNERERKRKKKKKKTPFFQPFLFSPLSLYSLFPSFSLPFVLLYPFHPYMSSEGNTQDPPLLGLPPPLIHEANPYVLIRLYPTDAQSETKSPTAIDIPSSSHAVNFPILASKPWIWGESLARAPKDLLMVPAWCSDAAHCRRRRRRR